MEINTDEVANKKISEFQTEKLRFLGDKECRSSEKLHVDSLCRAKASGDVRVYEISTVSAKKFYQKNSNDKDFSEKNFNKKNFSEKF